MSLPPLYHLDDYSGCVERGNDYCTVIGALSSTSPDNPLWREIIANQTSDVQLDKTSLHRGLCIPKEYSGNMELQKQYSETYMNGEISHLNLTSKIIQFVCLRSPKFKLYDYLFVGAVVLYCSLVIAVSVYDKWIVKKKSRDSVIWNFSIFYNWNSIVHAKTGRDYERLKSMQAMRFIQMLLNISAHSLLCYLFIFVDDHRVVEKRGDEYTTGLLRAIVPLVVQTFFLLSSWLCTLNIYNIYEANGKFTFKDLIITIVNRYFRMLPGLLFICILLSSEVATIIGSSPHLFYAFSMFKSACETNMMATLFFYNNYFFIKDTCNPTTWYTSVDFQFYVLTSVTVYLILKFKWNLVKVVIIGSVLSSILYGSRIYAKSLDTAFQVRMIDIQLIHFQTSVKFRENYTSTHSSLSTPLVGILLGFLYVKSRHRTDLHKNKILVTLWYVLFYGLLLLSIFLSTIKFGPAAAAIVGPLLKPMFAFSIGVGILGMSHNIGGITKKILECRFFEIMGNFCYGTFITHVLFSFTKGLTYYTAYPTNSLETDLLADFVGSFLSGTFLSLVLEQPASVLQKNILPQVKKKSKVAEKSEMSVQDRADGKHKHS